MPRFQGIKSSCPKTSALAMTSPLATLMIYSKSISPDCSMVFSPVMTPSISTSIISGIRCTRSWLEDTFKTGAIGFQVGVPRPVVKITMFAPEPIMAMVLSTSFPSAHNRFSPGVVIYSPQSRTAEIGKVPPFFCRSGRFHGVGNETILYISWMAFPTKARGKLPSPNGMILIGGFSIDFRYCLFNVFMLSDTWI